MEQLDFFLTLEKLFLLARGLDDFLEEHGSLLLRGKEPGQQRIVSILCTAAAEIRQELERLAMMEPLQICQPAQPFPIDNAADSGYDKAE